VRTEGTAITSRRRLLGTAAVAVAATTTVAGCGLFDDDPAPVTAPDPLTPVLAGALALAVSYDRAAVAQPGLAARLTPLAEAHRAHAAELARVIGATASAPASASPSGTPAKDASATLQELRTAEQAAQRTAAGLCRTAPANRAALVGSIAAARATHAEALR
jgi:hypothetical protein